MSNDLQATVQQMRIYLGDNYEMSLDMRKIFLDLLVTLIESPKADLDGLEGEILTMLLEIEDRTMDVETDLLVKELKLKLRRILKGEAKIIRGRDNTDLYKQYRDADGYITDLSLMVTPYSTQRIEHRTGDILHYTEEIYIDSLGRYFRKIYENHNEETEDAIAADILSNFE